MTLERSVLLLVLMLAGLYVLPRLLPRKLRLRRGLQVLCIMAAMLDAAYILPVSYTHLTLPTNREV